MFAAVLGFSVLSIVSLSCESAVASRGKPFLPNVLPASVLSTRDEPESTSSPFPPPKSLFPPSLSAGRTLQWLPSTQPPQIYPPVAAQIQASSRPPSVLIQSNPTPPNSHLDVPLLPTKPSNLLPIIAIGLLPPNSRRFHPSPPPSLYSPLGIPRPFPRSRRPSSPPYLPYSPNLAFPLPNYFP